MNIARGTQVGLRGQLLVCPLLATMLIHQRYALVDALIAPAQRHLGMLGTFAQHVIDQLQRQRRHHARVFRVLALHFHRNGLEIAVQMLAGAHMQDGLILVKGRLGQRAHGAARAVQPAYQAALGGIIAISVRHMRANQYHIPGGSRHLVAVDGKMNAAALDIQQLIIQPPTRTIHRVSGRVARLHGAVTAADGQQIHRVILAAVDGPRIAHPAKGAVHRFSSICVAYKRPGLV